MRLRLPLLAALSFAAVCALAQDAAKPIPREWIDKDTGHRIVRLSDVDGSQSFYFNVNSYSPDGRKMLITTPQGMANIDLVTRKIEPILPNEAAPSAPDDPTTRNKDAHQLHPVIVGKKTGRVYYIKDKSVWWVDPKTQETKKIADMSDGSSLSTVNADETLLAGTTTTIPFANANTMAGNEKLTPAQREERYRVNKGQMMVDRLHAHYPMTIFTLNIATGEKRTLVRDTEWLNHLLFSPGDPKLLLFCHEGPWQEVQRIWLKDVTNDSPAILIHKRTMQMEIAGHEFWSADGKTIWYDLQTPRGEDFWVAGYNVPTLVHEACG